MLIFEYRCAYGEPIEAFFPLGKAPDEIRCEDHNTLARRTLSRGAWSAFPGSSRYEHRA